MIKSIIKSNTKYWVFAIIFLLLAVMIVNSARASDVYAYNMLLDFCNVKYQQTYFNDIAWVLYKHFSLSFLYHSSDPLARDKYKIEIKGLISPKFTPSCYMEVDKKGKITEIRILPPELSFFSSS